MIRNISKYIKVSITLLLLVFYFNTNAQIYLSGIISDNTTNAGVPGRTVYISTDTSNQQVYFLADTIQTDGQGLFVDTVSPPSGVFVKYYVSAYDCNQVLQTDSIYSVYPFPINISICTSGINLCLADFVAYPDTADSQQIHFYNISSSNITASMWNFGDGNYSSAQHPSHTYNYGTYQVCLSVDDSASGCSHIYCDSLKVSPVMDCTNSITFSKLSPKEFSFTGNVNGLYPTLYYWDFGDGNIANGKNVLHEYLQPGFYTVSLSSTSIHPQTLDTCMSSSLTMVHVTGDPTAGVWGQVFADSLEVDYAMVYLYSYDQSMQQINLVDSTNIIINDSTGLGSYYSFSGLDYGKYVAYFMLLPNSIFCGAYAPAYSGNTIYWNDADIFDLYQISTAVPINLTHLYPLNGSSSISGSAYEGSKADPGDPKKDVPIYLLDQNGAVVDFAFTNVNGSYSFDSLIIQDYHVYSDVVNHEIFPARVEIVASNQHINNINVYISQTSVTSIGENNNYSFKVFPNPANQLLNIHFVYSEYKDVEFRMFNLMGQEVLSYHPDSSEPATYSQNSNSSKYKLDISKLNNGIYFLQISIGSYNLHVEKIIITK